MRWKKVTQKSNRLKYEKHQTRISLLLELVSDAYLTANRTDYTWSSTQKIPPLSHKPDNNNSTVSSSEDIPGLTAQGFCRIYSMMALIGCER